MARRGTVSRPRPPCPRRKSAPRNRTGYREADIVPCDFHGLGQIQLVCLKSAQRRAVNHPRHPVPVQAARREAVNRPQLPCPPGSKARPRNRLGYREADIVPCDFRGLGQIRLVYLEKWLGAKR